MSANKHIPWLLDQLALLVRDQVITPETATAIEARYRPLSTGRSQQNRISLALAVIGAVLISGGVILLLAHNWANYTRSLRILLSLLPLLLAQAATLYAFTCQRHSRPWQEATAIMHVLMIGSSLSLVGQTYHLPASPSAFMMTWVLLAIPMTWLIHSISLHVLVQLGILLWFFRAQDSIGRNLAFAGLVLVMTPAVIRFRKIPVPCSGHPVSRWSAAVVLLFTIPNMLIRDLGSTLLISFSLLLSVYSLLEKHESFHSRRYWEKPFSIIGNAGIFTVLLLCTVPEIWTDLHLLKESANNHVILFSLLGLAGVLLVTRWKHLDVTQRIIGLTGPLTLVAALVSATHTSRLVFYWFFFAWLAGLGITLLATGFSHRRLSRVNLGMVVLLIHIFIQFLRADVGYMARSLVFIGMGTLFLLFNRFLSHRWRTAS